MTLTFTPSPAPIEHATSRSFPILDILHPREHMRLIAVSGSLALGGAIISRVVFNWALWQAVALVLTVMAVPATIKWRSDTRCFGRAAAVAGALVTLQGLHTVEHVTQWVQRHILHEPLRQANGLLSPANSEWIHFLWNWSVMIPVVYLMSKGMRGFWGGRSSHGHLPTHSNTPTCSFGISRSLESSTPSALTTSPPRVYPESWGRAAGLT